MWQILCVLHSRNYNFMVPWSWKDDSNCNTTDPSDGLHPATCLGTHPTIVSPIPTWLHPKSPCIYAEPWVEFTQMKYQFTVSWAWKDASNCNTNVQIGRWAHSHTFGYTSYTHISSSYLATSKHSLRICLIPSVIHSMDYEFMVSWAWKDDSNCNTTVPSDGLHPSTHLGTLPTLVSPISTSLYPDMLWLYA